MLSKGVCLLVSTPVLSAVELCRRGTCSLGVNRRQRESTPQNLLSVMHSVTLGLSDCRKAIFVPSLLPGGPDPVAGYPGL